MAVTRSVWGYLERRDFEIMRRVNRWRAPRFIRFWMLLMTRLGDGLLWYALALVVLFCGGPNRFRAVFTGWVAAVVAVVLFRQIKMLSKRPRPCQIEPHCWAVISPPDQFSFPSGHTMTSFAIAVSVGYFYPGCLACLLFLAAAIGLSRIILGMHFLTDVLVGMFLGTAIGYASVWIFALS